MIRPYALSAACLLALGVSACKDQAGEETSAAAETSEILPGSANDDMLPYGRTRSQPELESPEAAEDAGVVPGGADGTGAAEGNAEAAPSDNRDAAPAPAAEATPDEE